MTQDNGRADQPIQSKNSGSYDPGPLNTENDYQDEEVSVVRSHTLDLALEEFAEGPYGSVTNEEKLGKVSEWKPGQAFSGRFRDSNLIRSDRKVALREEPDIGMDNLDRQN